MECPECGFGDSKVVDSRPTENKIRRRRECLRCKVRFTTYEIVETMPLMVVKHGGLMEPFDREKLISGIYRSTAKRPIQLPAIQNMADDISTQLHNDFKDSITSDEIGEMVLKKLKNLDKVAYIRFASVYRDFSNVDEFVKIISELARDN